MQIMFMDRAIRVNKNKYILAGVFMSCLFSHAALTQPRYTFNKLTNKDGLSYNTVKDIDQDSSGVLWVATKLGLNKYNSYGFTSYYHEDGSGIPGNFCSTIIITSENILYLGTDNGMARYNRDSDTFTSMRWKGKNLPPVNCFFETSEKHLMIGTADGYFRYFPEVDLMQKQTALFNKPILSMLEYDKESYLVSTNEGIYRIAWDGIILGHLNSENTDGLTSNLVQLLYRDNNKRIWVGTIDAGLFLYNPIEEKLEAITLTSQGLSGAEFIHDIKEDRDGKLWIGTEAGLFIYDPKTRETIHIEHSLEASDYFLNDNPVYCLFLSKENIMWIGTYFGGINYTLIDNRKNFHHLYPGNDANELKGKAVNRLMETSSGVIWIATEDGGVCALDPRTQTILEYYQYGPNGGLSSNNIHSICEDKNGNIWFGHFSTGIDIFNPRTETFSHVLPNPDQKEIFDYNSVYTLFVDSKEKLWVGTRANIRIYDYEKKRFNTFKPDKTSNYFIYNIMEDRSGKMWFCTRNHGIINWDPENDSLRHFQVGTEYDRGLSSNQIISSFEDSRGWLWFGTMEGGASIYHPERDTFELIHTKEGLSNKSVFGILEDGQGNIWLSTNEGLYKYNPITQELKNYTTRDGLTQMQFNYGSYFKDMRGTLYFGSIEGLTYFDPAEIGDNIIPPYVMLSDFKLFNQSVEIGERGLLERSINDTKAVTLKYSQNVFTIDYVAINYFSSGNNLFYYYLEGFESGWNNAENRTSVTYTNLSPGHYTFRLKAVNNDGIESLNTKELQINVLRPWWLSTVAFIIYILFIITGLAIMRRITILRENERSALRLEKLEKERIKQLTQQRINFFTYISHEFKTPLSIILASIDELLNSMDLSSEISRRFDRIKRSTDRLNFLIGQLMDFRRIETKHAKLVLNKGDIITYLKNICQAFTPIFSRQQITYNFKSSSDSYICWFDADKIEKILTNLLSNAVKYTPALGEISCELNILTNSAGGRDTNDIQISIFNTGKGMDERELELAFGQFYVGEKAYSREYGTGIGLTLVKSLTEYMQGGIEAESFPDKGTRFTVTLPANLTRASNIQLDTSEINLNRDIDLEYLSYYSDIQIEEPEQGEPCSYHILIVEDTLDLAEVLIQHFSVNYRVSFAKDGLEALETLKHEEPDLIISDIMMPGLNGLELCKRIKAFEATSHIAVILLTAKVSHEEKIDGLKAGAEAYVSKPFDFKELDLHVRHFIEIRRKLKKSLLLDNSPDLENIKIHDKDKQFIEKVTRIINDNIENGSFSIEDLASQLGMSKTLVYLKHTKLLSMSAKEYLQLLRFKRAINYMLSGEYNISEIAYKVGFSDPNYFSRAFRKVYKVSPTEYKEQFSERFSETPSGQE